MCIDVRCHFANCPNAYSVLYALRTQTRSHCTSSTFYSFFWMNGMTFIREIELVSWNRISDLGIKLRLLLYFLASKIKQYPCKKRRFGVHKWPAYIIIVSFRLICTWWIVQKKGCFRVISFYYSESPLFRSFVFCCCCCSVSNTLLCLFFFLPWFLSLASFCNTFVSFLASYIVCSIPKWILLCCHA